MSGKPIETSSSILLAISGGLDSMCMLSLFANKQLESKRLFAVYINHNLRPDVSEDISLIKKKCGEYNIPFYELVIDSDIFKEHGKGGIEAIARRERYNLLFKLKNELQADFLATAHHKNDQVETVFLRIHRGTGLKGLRGILKIREDGVIRPMLNWTKKELAEYAQKNNLEWREDSTNKNTDFFRNKVRLKILPALSSSEPTITNTLSHIADLAQSIYPKAMQIINSFFKPYLINAENISASQKSDRPNISLNNFYLPIGYEELFRLWLAEKGFSWEETQEDKKLYLKLQKNASFKFRLGKIFFERKKRILTIGNLC